MTFDELTNALFSSGKPGSQPASNGLLGLFDSSSGGQSQGVNAAKALMAQGGPQFLPQQQMPQMQGGGGPRGEFPFFAPTINPMPIQPQIPNFAALLQAIRQSRSSPF